MSTRLLILVVVLALFPCALNADDGWRRTAQGWEHISHWNAKRLAVAEARPAPSGVSFLQLSVFEIALSAAALALFSPSVRYSANSVLVVRTEGDGSTIP
jgi:hypothetical protein